MRAILSVLVSVLWAAAAQAADFTKGQGGDCTWAMRGEIAEGDAERLAGLLPALDPEAFSQDVLCLESPGGSLSEAVKMGRLLYERGVGTRLNENATCLSACALLFMLGTYYEPGSAGTVAVSSDFRYPWRMMHVSARLGFHRPALRLPEGGSYAPEAVQQAFEVATNAALELVILSADDRIAPDLLEQVFAHSGNDFFYIDTVGKASRWQVQLIEATIPEILDTRAAYTMCNNLVFYKRTHAPDTQPFTPEAVELVTPQVGADGALFVVDGSDSGTFSHGCYILETGDMPGHAIVCGWHGPTLEVIGSFRCDDIGQSFKDFMRETYYSFSDALPPETPLQDMGLASRLIEERARAERAGTGEEFGRTALRRRCAVFRGQGAVSGVNEYAHLRSLPGAGSDSVARVDLGNTVLELDFYNEQSQGSRVIFDPRQEGRCAAICEYDAGPRSQDPDFSARNACFENGAYWYEVESELGERGYINGKFLRY